MITKAFSKILIPVDFSVNTEIAVKKAMLFAERQDGEIHLLHIVKPKKGPTAKFKLWEAEKKLTQWKVLIGESIKEIKVNSVIIPGSSIEKMIVETANLLSPDLIIIGKKGRNLFTPNFRSVSPDYIASRSNCPVLTAKLGSMYSRIKIIVIPVRDFVPERKLKLAIQIARKYRAQVHLLAISENSKSNANRFSQPFLTTYHQLRENLHHPVEYYPISQRNTAKATLKYAESVMADIILLHPGTESGNFTLTGSRHISDWIGNNSKIQVLDIHP